MTTQFLQSDLWNKVTALATRAKRRYVAVAYLGKGATELLPLNQGDVLVVDMSLSAVRAGQTNPAEVLEYLKRGVEIHSCSNLHAKVFVFDKKAVVGSANVSGNSKNNLVEAVLLTTDKDVVRTARGFVFSLMGELVTPQYAKSCKKIYRPSLSSNGPNNDNTPAHSRLWVQRIFPLRREDPQRTKAAKSGLKLAKKKLKNKKLYEVEDISYSARSQMAQRATFSDLVIQVWFDEDDKSLWVYPPGRIVNTKPFVSERGTKKILLFFEVPKSPQRIAWQEFKRTMRRAGASRVGPYIDREITDPNLKHKLLGLWPSWHEE
jgi:hypothetical protein